jgi:signal transduction histidine kinase
MSQGDSSPHPSRERVQSISAVARTSVLWLLPAAGAAIAAEAAGLRWQSHLADSNLRTCLETTIALSVLLACALLMLQIRRGARLQDGLLLSALLAVGVTDFVFLALPNLVGLHVPAYGADARQLAGGLVPLVFLAAAFAGGAEGLRVRRGRAMLIGGASLAAVSVIEVLDLITGGGGHLARDLTTSLAVLEAVIFVIAAVAFIWRFAADSTAAILLASASLLLAGARLQTLAIQTVPADWTTLRDLLRVAAYGLLLAVVARDYGLRNRAHARNAIRAERERIARDIHDGLAQDLATIALHAQSLESSLGEAHPLTVAARRALASSRETIVDLSASRASSTSEAIRTVADELEARFGIEVTVNDYRDGEGTARDLAPRAREQAVRIAREAIVNAARHGGARHVEVTLEVHAARCLLRISDDGSGIEPAALASSTGFGLRTMRARAAELGAELTTRDRLSGGTVLELSFARRAPR